MQKDRAPKDKGQVKEEKRYLVSLCNLIDLYFNFEINCNHIGFYFKKPIQISGQNLNGHDGID